nr:unnamed protein product [Digitaria exilis]
MVLCVKAIRLHQLQLAVHMKFWMLALCTLSLHLLECSTLDKLGMLLVECVQLKKHALVIPFTRQRALLNHFLLAA